MEDTVIDAPEVDQAADFSADAPESTPEQNAPISDQSAAPPEVPKPAGEPKQFVIDGKKLDADAHATLTELAKTNPQLSRELRDALFQADGIKRMGGLTEIRNTVAAVKEFGGVDGIKQTLTAYRELDNLDRQFTAGDPKFIQAMVGTPEGKEAFAQLAPDMVNEWSRVNQSGWASYMAKVALDDAERTGRMSFNIELLEHHIGDNPKALSIIARMKAYFEELGKVAKGSLVPEKMVAPPDERERGLSERESKLQLQEFNGPIREGRKSIFESSMAELTAGRKLTDQQKAAALKLASTMISEHLQGTDYNAKLESFFKAKDNAGAAQYSNGILKRAIPRIVKEALDTYGTVQQRPGPKPGQPTVAPTPGVPRGTSAGYQRIAAPPKPDQIDRVASAGLIREGKAVLLDGRRVVWR